MRAHFSDLFLFIEINTYEYIRLIIFYFLFSSVEIWSIYEVTEEFIQFSR